MIEEIYKELQTNLELTGNLNLVRNKIYYIKYNFCETIEEFYKECIDEKNEILECLPNGFKLDDFNYDEDFISFNIKPINY